MPVRIRLFAALREAAGTSETKGTPGPLADLLAELEARYGEPFASRLSVASVLVDGQQTDRHADIDVPDGAEVALLPPFSGGAAADVATTAERGAGALGAVALALRAGGLGA